MATIKLIVGLGNPGLKYAHTRHNAGVWFIEALADSYKFPAFKMENKLKGLLSQCQITDITNVKLFLPSTYMNDSGLAVAIIARYFQFSPTEILIVHDELDLLVGNARIKNSGGHGGHNGLRSIIQHLGSKDFHRLRIGIDHPGHKQDVHNYVLSRPSVADKKCIDNIIVKCLQQLHNIINQDWPTVMNTLHSFTG